MELSEIRRLVDTDPTCVEEALDQIEAIKAGVTYWNGRLAIAVQKLLSEGVTYQRIAEALGVSAQAAHQRFRVTIDAGS